MEGDSLDEIQQRLEEMKKKLKEKQVKLDKYNKIQRKKSLSLKSRKSNSSRSTTKSISPVKANFQSSDCQLNPAYLSCETLVKFDSKEVVNSHLENRPSMPPNSLIEINSHKEESNIYGNINLKPSITHSEVKVDDEISCGKSTSNEITTDLCKNQCDELDSDVINELLNDSETPIPDVNVNSSKDQNLNDFHLNNLKDVSDKVFVQSLLKDEEQALGCCLSVSPGGNLMALVVCQNIFYIWELFSTDSVISKGDWKCCCVEEIELIEQSQTSAMFGVRSSESCTQFLVLRAPSVCDRFHATCVRISGGEPPEVLNKNTNIAGCYRCSFHACSGSPWNFWLYIDGCSNPGCPNSSNSSKVLWNLSYDVVFSEKIKKRDLVFEQAKQTSLNCAKVLSLKRLFSNSVDETTFLFIQDESRIHFYTNDRVFPLLQSSCMCDSEWRETVSEGVLLHAAGVKNILLLVFEFNHSLRFFGISSSSSSPDLFYQINLREFENLSKIRSSVFFKNGFYFIDHNGKILSLNIL